MKRITAEIIEEASEEINNLDDIEIEALVDKFSQEQPYLMTYLMAIFDEDLNETERELLFLLGIKIWYAALKGEKKITQVNEQLIDDCDADNEEMLNYLSEESEEGFADFAENFIKDHPQSDLMEFAIIAVMEDEDEEDQDLIIRDDVKGIMFIALKTVVDCLEKV